MTVETSAARSGPYNGNGVTTSFSWAFPVIDADTLKVYKTVSGVTTEVTTGITKTGVPGASGTVVFAVAPASGEQITLIRESSGLQESDYSLEAAIPPTQVETDLDAGAMFALELSEKLNRSIKVPVNTDVSSFDATLPAPEAGKAIAWNATADGLENGPDVSSLSSSVAAAQAAQAAAESARDSALAAYDSFDDRYLGVKASDPALDNDGNALVAGALYFNSTAGEMRIWTGSLWVAAYVSGAGLGTMSTQDANAVAVTGGTISGADIDGGTIDDSPIGASVASTGKFTTVQTSGVVNVGYAVNTEDAALQLGDARTGNGFAYIDFVGDTVNTGYGLRVIRNNTGENADSELLTRGTGALRLKARDAGSVVLGTTDLDRLTIDAGGALGIGATPDYGAAGQVLTSAGPGALPTWGSGASSTQHPSSPIAPTTETAVDFTGIPSGVTEIEMGLVGVGTNSTNDMVVQLGDSGGFETSGYVSSSASFGGDVSGASGMAILYSGSDVTVLMRFVLMDAATNTWMQVHGGYGSTDRAGGGSKSLSGELTQIRLTTSGGVDQFNSGNVYLKYK